jgi:hypothetical protein
MAIVVDAIILFIYICYKKKRENKERGMSTFLSLFKRDFAKARHGVTKQLEEFIFVT